MILLSSREHSFLLASREAIDPLHPLYSLYTLYTLYPIHPLIKVPRAGFYCRSCGMKHKRVGTLWCFCILCTRITPIFPPLYFKVENTCLGFTVIQQTQKVIFVKPTVNSWSALLILYTLYTPYIPYIMQSLGFSVTIRITTSSKGSEKRVLGHSQGLWYTKVSDSLSLWRCMIWDKNVRKR